MRIPFARTSAETQLFLDLNRCPCGDGNFPGRGLPWSAAVLEVGPENTVRHDWVCPGCGRHREYCFRTPAEPEPFPRAGDSFRWGDGVTPSELLDPGQWMIVADRYAGQDGAKAAAALDEVLLFVKRRLLGRYAVPRAAFRTAAGRARFRKWPAAFEKGRLESVRDGYRERSFRS